MKKTKKAHLLGTTARCIIPGCKNRFDEGFSVGALCLPCYEYLIDNRGTHSQAYRNEITKSNLRMASKIKSMPRDQAWALLISRLLSSKDMARLRKDLCRG